MMRLLLTAPLAVLPVLGLVLSACGGSGSLAPPKSDNQSDDPCDPGGGGNTTGPAAPVDAGAAPVTLPGTPPGVGFDDLRFSGTLSMLLVPAGRTGNLDLIDPSSEAITPVSGFSTSTSYGGDDTFGVTSADEGNALVYAVDRTSGSLAVVDPKARTILSKTTLAATPGYVRYVAATNEIWVTEPSQHQIEVFSAPATPSAAPVHSLTIPVSSGGPISLEIDQTGGVAYTNGTSTTIAIDPTKHAVSGQWSNGCTTSQGIAVDAANGWIIPVCEEGLVVVLSTQGATIGTAQVGGGVNQVTYDSSRQRLYVPTPAASSMSVVGFSSMGVPKVMGSIDTTNDAHCAVSAGQGSVYVCAPSLGQLLFVTDPF